jgi:hypothetical protein
VVWTVAFDKLQLECAKISTELTGHSRPLFEIIELADCAAAALIWHFKGFTGSPTALLSRHLNRVIWLSVVRRHA